MPRENNKQIIEAFLALYCDGRWGDANCPPVDEMLSRITDDVEWWVSGLPAPGLITKQKFRQMIALVCTSADDAMKLVPTGWTIEGDRVAVEAYSVMRLKNGKTYNNHYHFLFELRDGKIAKFHEHSDTAHVRDVFASVLE